MRKSLSILIAPLVALACSTGQPLRPSSMSLEVERQSVEQGLLRINRDIMESMILENDAAALLRHAHDEFLVVAPGGRIEDREQAAAGAQSFAARGVSIAEEQVTLVDNTAVVVGRLEIDGEMRPVGQLPPMKFMAVFVRQGSEWKLLSRALTPCLPMAIERGFC